MRRWRLLRWDHNGLTVLATLALGITVAGAGLGGAAPGNERFDAVFQAELDDICTNATGRVEFDNTGLFFNDGDTRLRHMPEAWQRGEPIPGQIFVDDEGGTFFSDDGVELRFSNDRYVELHCALG